MSLPGSSAPPAPAPPPLPPKPQDRLKWSRSAAFVKGKPAEIDAKNRRALADASGKAANQGGSCTVFSTQKRKRTGPDFPTSACKKHKGLVSGKIVTTNVGEDSRCKSPWVKNKDGMLEPLRKEALQAAIGEGLSKDLAAQATRYEEQSRDFKWDRAMLEDPEQNPYIEVVRELRKDNVQDPLTCEDYARAEHDVYFAPISGTYYVDHTQRLPYHQRLTIVYDGVKPDGEMIAVNMRGSDPYCYVRIPPEVVDLVRKENKAEKGKGDARLGVYANVLVAQLNTQLQNWTNTLLPKSKKRDDLRWVCPPPANNPNGFRGVLPGEMLQGAQLIRRHSICKKIKNMIGLNLIGKERFLRIELAHPMLVPECKRLLWNPSAWNRGLTLDGPFQHHAQGPNDGRRCWMVVEAEIPYIDRKNLDFDIVPSAWIRVTGGKYGLVPKHDQLTLHRIELECSDTALYNIMPNPALQLNKDYSPPAAVPLKRLPGFAKDTKGNLQNYAIPHTISSEDAEMCEIDPATLERLHKYRVRHPSKLDQQYWFEDDKRYPTRKPLIPVPPGFEEMMGGDTYVAGGDYGNSVDDEEDTDWREIVDPEVLKSFKEALDKLLAEKQTGTVCPPGPLDRQAEKELDRREEEAAADMDEDEAGGDRMPDPRWDSITTWCFDLENLSTGKAYKVAFVLGHLSMEERTNNKELRDAWVFEFATEKEMIEHIHMFSVTMRSDVLVSWNGAGFDHPYLVNRGLVLGVPMAGHRGYHIGRRVSWQNETTRGFNKTMVVIPGAFEYDLLKQVPKLMQFNDFKSYTLYYVCKRLLKINKIDFPHHMMRRTQRTAKGRARKTIYCMRDCALPKEIMKQYRIMPTQDSRLMCTFMQHLIDRGSMYRLRNCIMYFSKVISPRLHNGKMLVISSKYVAGADNKNGRWNQPAGSGAGPSNRSGGPGRSQADDMDCDDDYEREMVDDSDLMDAPNYEDSALAGMADLDINDVRRKEQKQGVSGGAPVLAANKKGKFKNVQITRNEKGEIVWDFEIDWPDGDPSGGKDPQYDGAFNFPPRRNRVTGAEMKNFFDRFCGVLDFASLYPSNMMQENLSPDTMLLGQQRDFMMYGEEYDCFKEADLVEALEPDDPTKDPDWEEIRPDKERDLADPERAKRNAAECKRRADLRDIYRKRRFVIRDAEHFVAMKGKYGKFIPEDSPIKKRACFAKEKVQKGVITEILWVLKLLRGDEKKKMGAWERRVTALKGTSTIYGMKRVIDTLRKVVSPEWAATSAKGGADYGGLHGLDEALDALRQYVKGERDPRDPDDVRGSLNDLPQHLFDALYPADGVSPLEWLQNPERAKQLWDQLAELADWCKEQKVVSSFEFDVCNARQDTIKRIMNSIYGLFGSIFSPIPVMEIAEATTKTGVFFIKFCISYVEHHFRPENGCPFLCTIEYGDTDSMMIWFKRILGAEPSPDEESKIVIFWLKAIAAGCNRAMKEQFGCLYMSLEVEKLFWNFMLDVRKKYAAWWWFLNGKKEFKIKGMHCVRADCSDFFANLQYDVLQMGIVHSAFEAAFELAIDRIVALRDRDGIMVSDIGSSSRFSDEPEKYKVMLPHVRLALRHHQMGTGRYRAGDRVKKLVVEPEYMPPETMALAIEKVSYRTEDMRYAQANNMLYDAKYYMEAAWRMVRRPLWRMSPYDSIEEIDARMKSHPKLAHKKHMNPLTRHGIIAAAKASDQGVQKQRPTGKHGATTTARKTKPAAAVDQISKDRITNFFVRDTTKKCHECSIVLMPAEVGKNKFGENMVCDTCVPIVTAKIAVKQKELHEAQVARATCWDTCATCNVDTGLAPEDRTKWTRRVTMDIEDCAVNCSATDCKNMDVRKDSVGTIALRRYELQQLGLGPEVSPELKYEQSFNVHEYLRSKNPRFRATVLRPGESLGDEHQMLDSLELELELPPAKEVGASASDSSSSSSSSGSAAPPVLPELMDCSE